MNATTSTTGGSSGPASGPSLVADSTASVSAGATPSAADPGSGAPDTFAEGHAVAQTEGDRFDAALDAACDYRGDVTLVLSGDRRLEGFLYDRRRPRGGAPAAVRMLPKDGSPRVTIPEGEIARLEVTGKDTAAGKTFENWVRRYAERKLKGLSANIESESLDDADE